MGLFSRKKDRKMQSDLLTRLDGRELHYVVRRLTKDDGSTAEQVLGKGGRIMAPGDYVAVTAGQTEVFRCETPETVSCGELMALNGVLIKGYNILLEKEDTLVAYYAYYRK